MFLPFLRWLLFIPVELCFLLVALLLAPVLPLFASEAGWLPPWLSWFGTSDNPLDGDSGFLSEHAPFLGPQTGWRRYLNRVAWLIRNPAYGFDFAVLGFVASQFTTWQGWGDITADDTRDGWYLHVGTNPDGSSAWQFWLSHHWTADRFLRINLGWKLWAAPGLCQFVIAAHPWRAN